jgi:hypothetical protein
MHWKKMYFPTYHGFNNAHFMWNQALVTPRDAPFLALLHAARSFNCTDPRDQVFALLHHRIYRRLCAKEEENIIDRTHSFFAQDVSTFRILSAILSSLTCARIKALTSASDPTTTRQRRRCTETLLCDHLRNTTHSSEVLCYAWQTAHDDASWPSWIPQWRIPNTLSNPILSPFLYDAARVVNI